MPEAEVLADMTIRIARRHARRRAADPRARAPRRSGEGGAPRRAPRRSTSSARPTAMFELTGPRIPDAAHARHRLHVCGGDCREPGAGSATSSWRSKRRGDTSRGPSGTRRASARGHGPLNHFWRVPLILLEMAGAFRVTHEPLDAGGDRGHGRQRRLTARSPRSSGWCATTTPDAASVARLRSVRAAGGEGVRADRRRKRPTRWPGARLAIHHRTGRVEIGEASVAIVGRVAAPRRRVRRVPLRDRARQADRADLEARALRWRRRLDRRCDGGPGGRGGASRRAWNERARNGPAVRAAARDRRHRGAVAAAARRRDREGRLERAGRASFPALADYASQRLVRGERMSTRGSTTRAARRRRGRVPAAGVGRMRDAAEDDGSES